MAPERVRIEISGCSKQWKDLPFTWTLNSSLSSAVWQEYVPLSLDSVDFTIRVREKPSLLISYLVLSFSSTPSLNHFTLPPSAVSSVVKMMFSLALTSVSLTVFFWNLTAASEKVESFQCFMQMKINLVWDQSSLKYMSPVICNLNSSFSVPASHVYSPASFLSIFSITNSRVLPLDSIWTALLEVSSLPSLYHFTSVLESDTSQLRVAFWEREAFTSLCTDSLAEKPAGALGEKKKINQKDYYHIHIYTCQTLKEQM